MTVVSSANLGTRQSSRYSSPGLRVTQIVPDTSPTASAHWSDQITSLQSDTCQSPYCSAQGFCNRYGLLVWFRSIVWYSVFLMIEFDTHDVLCLVLEYCLILSIFYDWVWYSWCFMFGFLYVDSLGCLSWRSLPYAPVLRWIESSLAAMAIIVLIFSSPVYWVSMSCRSLGCMLAKNSCI